MYYKNNWINFSPEPGFHITLDKECKEGTEINSTNLNIWKGGQGAYVYPIRRHFSKRRRQPYSGLRPPNLFRPNMHK